MKATGNASAIGLEKNNQMKPDPRQALTAAPLARIRRYLASHYGATAQLRRDFEKATGQKVYRSSFTRWLHVDPAKRQQPSLGTYLLLEKLVKERRGK